MTHATKTQLYLYRCYNQLIFFIRISWKNRKIVQNKPNYYDEIYNHVTKLPLTANNSVLWNLFTTFFVIFSISKAIIFLYYRSVEFFSLQMSCFYWYNICSGQKVYKTWPGQLSFLLFQLKLILFHQPLRLLLTSFFLQSKVFYCICQVYHEAF